MSDKHWQESTEENIGCSKTATVKSGILVLIQKIGKKQSRIPVSVKVYKNNFEHYAVVQTGHKIATKTMFVNLKHSTVQASDTNSRDIIINSSNVDGISLVFQTKQPSEVSDWLDSLKFALPPGQRSPSLSPVIPRARLMPVLQESIEEEEDQSWQRGGSCMKCVVAETC